MMTKDDWIRVSERMPPEEHVLVVVERRGYRILDRNMAWWDEDRQEWHTRAGMRLHGKVTHWMPLPELPEVA